MLAALMLNSEPIDGHFIPGGGGKAEKQHARHPVLPMLHPEIDEAALLKKLRGDIKGEPKATVATAKPDPVVAIKVARAAGLEDDMARAILEDDDEAMAVILMAAHFND